MDTLWAQRCKLYTYRRRTQNWVQLGVGKGSLVRMTPTGRVEFVFEEESLRVPMAKHTVATSSGLRTNSGTDKGWSWTAFDTIQLQDGEAEQWFTAKFSTTEVAQSFKDAFGKLKDNTDADVIPPGIPADPLRESKGVFKRSGRKKTSSRQVSASPEPDDLKASGPGLPQISKLRSSSAGPRGSDSSSDGKAFAAALAARVPAKTTGMKATTALTRPPPLVRSHSSKKVSPSSMKTLSTGLPSLGGSQPRSSPPSSPKLQAQMTQSFASMTTISLAHQSRQDSWLLYFERGMLNKRNRVREASTIYLGVYSSKEKALVSSVRAMDEHCDKNQPWRSKACWDSVVDRRRTVGDRGVIIAVEAEDGAFNHVKLRKLPYDMELQPSGLPEGDQLWESLD